MGRNNNDAIPTFPPSLWLLLFVLRLRVLRNIPRMLLCVGLAMERGSSPRNQVLVELGPTGGAIALAPQLPETVDCSTRPQDARALGATPAGSTLAKRVTYHSVEFCR